jgi:hypothetical protein
MLSTSAANADRYYWMRYASERATNVVVRDEKVKISRGDLFGVRELRGKDFDEVMLITGQTLRLSIPKSELLMNRGKEYRGAVRLKLEAKTKVPAKVQKTAMKKVVVSPTIKQRTVTPSGKHQNEKKYLALMKKVGGHKTSHIVAAMDLLKDDAERLDFKQWVLTKLERGTEKYGKVLAMSVKRKAAGPKIIVSPAQKSRVTKLIQHQPIGKQPMLKLSEIEMPTIDDFTDHELPEEFRQYVKVSQSATTVANTGV